MIESIKRKNKFSKLVGLIIILLSIFVVFNGKNGIASVIDLEKINKTSDPKKLDKYKDKVQKQLKSTTQQKNILASQVKLYDLKVNTAKRNLNNVEKEYQRNELELAKLQKEIEKKDAKIKDLKKELKKNLVLYQQNDDSFKIKLLSSGNDITTLLNEAEYLRRLSEGIDRKIKAIQEDKKKIKEKQEAIEKTKGEIEKNKKELLKKKDVLETQKRIKHDFLVKTQGDENKYKTLLAHIEEQKRKLFNLSEASLSTKESIKAIKSKAKKPTSGLASTSWYYAQDDAKWGYKNIGFSKTLMKDYGCAVTALSMVFTKEGEKINPGKLAKKPLFYRDLIVWPNKWGKLKLTSGRAHGNVSWSVVDKKIKKGIPVVVFIRSRSGAGHYVVIHHKDKKGKYVVHDPLFGANMYLETSKKLISSIYKSAVRVDQMIIYE